MFCSVGMSRCNNAVRYFSIVCLTSCSLFLFSDSCWVADCPDANDNKAIVMARCGILCFMVELLCSFIADLEPVAQVSFHWINRALAKQIDDRTVASDVRSCRRAKFENRARCC